MKLLEPITIRGMTIRNRIVMSSMGVGLGYTNQRVRDFYVERARGGVGAIIIGAGIPELFMSDEVWGKAGAVGSFIKRLQTLTGEVNKAGARIGIQFYYGNRYPFSLDPKTGELVAPSARIQPNPSPHAWVYPGERMRELTIEEIESIIERIGKAAAGAREAGFDFVELHNGHGLLPCQFFSPTTNQRTDKYGGDLKRRMRFGLECIGAMRSAVGGDYPLFVRHGVVDAVPDGFTVPDGVAFAVELEKAGVDVLNVSLGTPPFQGGYVPAGDDPVGTHVHLAEAVRRKVNVPVIGVGRIKTPEVAEAILSAGKADMVALGRQLFADPFWPQKAAAGKIADIIPCIDCHACYERSTSGSGIECTVNYSVGRETEAEIKVAEKPKKVLIVGGGPAGMEAARVAARRGHRVTFQEQGKQLGGAMLLQAVVPYKDEVENLTKYLSDQVRREGVKIELGKGATPESIRTAGPDVVIVATGASPGVPDIPGINRENVISSGAIRALMGGGPKKKGVTIRSGWRGTLIRVGAAFLGVPLSLSLRKRLAAVGTPIIFGKRVAIIGGGMTACQLADLLAANGRIVTIVAEEEELATDLVSTLRLRLLKRLAERGVAMVVGVKSYQGITNAGLVISNRAGAREVIAADSIMPMLDFKTSGQETLSLRGIAPEVYRAGDCSEPLKLLHAVHDGARLGRKI